MGTIYVDGQFKRSAQPVKIVEGSSGTDLGISKNYVTKEELLKVIDNLTASIKDHTIIDETLIIE